MTVFSDALRDLYKSMNSATGTVAVYNNTVVNGYFVRNYQPALDAENYGPVFKCLNADVPAVAVGSTIIIDTTTYKVKDPPQFGEHGEVLLILSRG